MLTNLVSNAIKFTREGTIAVRAMLEDDSDADLVQLRISVQDTGIGLSDEDLRALFQAFSQADNSLSRQAGGTGLGLVISKRLIEQMGGEIGVASTPGEGSEFWISVSLPKARDDADDLPKALLAGRYAAVFEPQELARQALHHQLEDCGLEVQDYPSLEALLEAVETQRNGTRAIGFAVMGVTARDLPPDRLSQYIWELDQLGCKSLVLCPTTEQALYHQVLPDSHNQLQAKPACTRKLHRALTGLVSPRQQPRLEAPQPQSTRAPKILCVDDNPANLLLVKTLLGDMGAQVTAVDSGYAAVEAAQHNFDLILMDVQMPGMDGRQATEEIRRLEAGSELSPVPIVALTAHALANEKRALLQGGMDDYLTKPIGERQLAQVVLKWTGLVLHSPAPSAAPSTRPTRMSRACWTRRKACAWPPARPTSPPTCWRCCWPPSQRTARPSARRWTATTTRPCWSASTACTAPPAIAACRSCARPASAAKPCSRRTTRPIARRSTSSTWPSSAWPGKRG